MTRIVPFGRGYTLINFGRTITIAGAGFCALWTLILGMRRYSDGRFSFPPNRKLSSKLCMSYQRLSRFRPARNQLRFVVFCWTPPKQRIANLQSEAGTELDILSRFGRVENVVRDAALAHEADLILIGRGVTHDVLGRLRSAAYGIIREAPCPVISI